MQHTVKIFIFLLALVLHPWLVIAAADTNAALFEDNGEGLEALYGDEEFVSIATGSQKPIYKAPAVASVITAEQIKRMGARTLDDVLETVPGLHVVPSDLNRLDSIYSIRGLHTGFNPQVLVLMNGVPFPLSYSGGRPFNFQFPVSSISKVEIIRGPGSAVYGADAFAGVINIITKSDQEIGDGEIGLRRGSFDSTDLWYQQGGEIGRVGVAFTLEWQKSDGDNDRVINSDLQSLFDPALSYAPGALATRYNLLDTHLELSLGNWTLRNWYWRQDDAGVGAGGARALDPNGYDNVDNYLADLTWKGDRLVEHWTFLTTLSYQVLNSETHFNLLPAGTTAPLGTDGNLLSFPPYTLTTFPDGMIGDPDIFDTQAGIDLVAIYTGLEKHRLRLGGGFKYQQEEFSEVKNFGPGVEAGTLTDVTDTPYIYMPDTDRSIWYLSLQDEWQMAPDWELTSGIRFDHYSDFGRTINPRLALVWATRYNLTSKILYGRAFRAPSFSEQFAQNNPVVIGNPDLEPETIDTVELAFDYRPTFDVQTNLNIYGYRANDLIEYVTDPNGISKTAQNSRDQVGYGIEVEVSWELTTSLKLAGNYAWQHAEDEKTGKRVADAPGQQLFVSGEWKFSPSWTASTQLNWVADRHRSENDNRPAIDDYVLVDLILRKAGIFKNLDLAIMARNLLEENAREPSSGSIKDDYPLEGRNLWAELSYRF